MSKEAPQGIISGDWYAFCDVCEGRFFGSTMKMRWDNLFVCDGDYEERHPQDFVKVNKDKRTPPVVRPRTLADGEATNSEDPYDIDTDAGWY